MSLDNDCDSGTGVIVSTSPGSVSGTHPLHSATGTGPGCGGGGGGGGFHLYPHIHGTGGMYYFPYSISNFLVYICYHIFGLF